MDNKLSDDELKFKKYLTKKIESFELDVRMHARGSCSFTVLAFCAGEEQATKRYFLQALEQYKSD